SAYLLGFFIALMGCGVLGLLFRVLHPARVRNAVLSLQIGFFVLLGIGPRILAAFRGVGDNITVANSTAFPLNWFVSLASPTSSGIRAFLTWPALLSMIGCGVFIAFGVQSLSEGYLSRVHHLLRSGPSGRRTYSGVIGTVVRILTGNPS